MSGFENMQIKELNELLQMIYDVIKQTHSRSEEKKDMLVLKNFLNIKENSDFNNLSDLDSLEEVIRASCPLLGIHDPDVYELLQKGLTYGIHDLDIFNRLIMKLRPSDFSDILALWPLYFSKSFLLGKDEEYYKRKNGLVDYSYLHPSLREVLCDTYGIYLYHEQIIKTAKIIAGFSKKQAKRFFKRLKKAKRAENDILCKTFIECSVKNGIEEELAKKIFETMRSSTLYAVCKFKYAEIATCVYKLAYLKAHYYIEFMTAFLNLKAKEYIKYIDLRNKELKQSTSEEQQTFQPKKFGYIDNEAFIYETKAFGANFSIPEFVFADKVFKTDGKTMWYE